MLSFCDEYGVIKLPSGGTLHYFVKYRLAEDGLNEVMMLLGEKILKLSQIKEAKIDYIPLEASRYDNYADYNVHYKCKMDKAHITMVGTYPVFMTYTNGVSSDSPELIKHIEALKKMNADIDFTLLMVDMIHFKTMQIFGIIWKQNQLLHIHQMLF